MTTKAERATKGTFLARISGEDLEDQMMLSGIPADVALEPITAWFERDGGVAVEIEWVVDE